MEFDTWKIITIKNNPIPAKTESFIDENAEHLLKLTSPIENQVVELVRLHPHELGLIGGHPGDPHFTYYEILEAAIKTGLRLCHPRIGWHLAKEWKLDTSYTVLGMEPVVTWTGGWGDHHSEVLEFLETEGDHFLKRPPNSILTTQRVNLGDTPLYTEYNPFIFQKQTL